MKSQPGGSGTGGSCRHDRHELLQRLEHFSQARCGSSMKERHDMGSFVSLSPGMKAVESVVRRIAPSDINVILLGEIGTGKERVGREIHARSRRSNQPFLVVHCQNGTPEEIDKAIFGPPDEAHLGKLEQAHGGTLYLHEIAGLPIWTQVRLLRVLETRHLDKHLETIPIDVRVIASTSDDLQKRVRDAQFRPDLYYSLRVVSVHVPPLRDRKEDITALASRFLAQTAIDKHPIRFAPDARVILTAHSWRGNIKELASVVQHVSAITSGNEIRASVLETVLAETPSIEVPEGVNTTTPSCDDGERTRIIAALISEGSCGKAARLLGMHRSTLYRKMRRYGLL